MKLIRTRIVTKPNKDVNFYDEKIDYDISQQYNNLYETMIAAGKIISKTTTISEDELSKISVIIFSSTDDFADYMTELHNLDNLTISFYKNELQYFAKNNIIITQITSYEE